MRRFPILVVLALIVVLTEVASGEQQAAGQVFGTGWEDLASPQQALLKDWIRRYAEVTGQKLDPMKAFEEAPVSVRTTYDAVTNALMSTSLTDENGKSLGTALDLISSIETVHGKVPGAGGDLQFRMYALLKPGAMETLRKSREFKRSRDNTIFHKGYPISFREQGGVPSIQFSISRDGTRTDIDVDYRSSKFPAALFNGHLTAGNSDVRAGNNYGRHVHRWKGLKDWWRNLFDFALIRNTTEQAPEDPNAIPAVPRAGKRKLPEAVYDFLHAMLVENKPGQALAYVASEAYDCYELQGISDGKPLNRGIAPYLALNRMKATNKQLRKTLGEITDLKQVVRGVRLTGYPELRVVKQPYQDRFVLYDVPEGMALQWACSTRLSGDKPVRSRSKRYGKYYLAVFRVPPQSQGSTIALLLAKREGYWKVLSFENDADVDYSKVPDLRPKDTTGKELKIAKAEPALVEAMTNFHRNWFLRRYYPGATRYFSNEAINCYHLYLQKGETPAANMDEFRERWRKGMERVVHRLGLIKTLSDAIKPVTLSADQLAVVPHRNEDAFTIFALSDELGETARCVASTSQPLQIEDKLLRKAPGGNYYAAAFKVVTAGGSPAALITLWRKIDGAWRIYSYRIEMP